MRSCIESAVQCAAFVRLTQASESDLEITDSAECKQKPYTVRCVIRSRFSVGFVSTLYIYVYV